MELMIKRPYGAKKAEVKYLVVIILAVILIIIFLSLVFFKTKEALLP